MKGRGTALSLAALVLLGTAMPVVAEDPSATDGQRYIQAIEAAFRQAIDRARPSVVSIFLIDHSDMAVPFGGNMAPPMPFSPESRSLDSDRFAPSGFGSGIVIDKEGLILTCHHVVRSVFPEGERVRYMLRVRLHDGSEYNARLYAADPRSDLAVIQLQSPEQLNLTPIKVADGSKLFPGQFVLAIGNPYGLAAPDGNTSASWGIVSNIRRRGVALSMDEADKTIHTHGTLIQTDARLNMGISGGALINTDGALVGVTMALSAAAGFETPGGFAAPTDELTRRTIETLRTGREVEYGFLGIMPRTISAEDARQRGYLPVAGALVERVYTYLPAYRAGLRQGDLITSINGKKIENHNDLVIAVGSLPVGTIMETEIVRAQKKESLKLPLAKFPVVGEVFATNKRPVWNGIRVDHLSTLTRDQTMSLDPLNSAPQGGVVIRDVIEGSAAYEKGLKASQIIQKVNDKAVFGPDEFEREVERASFPVKLSMFQGQDVIFDAGDKGADRKKAD